jgi:hypothetical protein
VGEVIAIGGMIKAESTISKACGTASCFVCKPLVHRGALTKGHARPAAPGARPANLVRRQPVAPFQFDEVAARAWRGATRCVATLAL